MGLFDRFRRPPAQIATEAALVPVAPVGDAAGAVARLLAATRKLAGYPAAGRYAGFYEPNVEVSPQDLYGLSPRQLGILFRMRWAHPVIASGMDFAARAIESVEYGLEPADASWRAIAARNAVERAIAQTQGLSLPTFVAETWDQTRTYGFAALEVIDAGDGHIRPRVIAPHVIQSWQLGSDYIELEGVSVLSGNGIRTIGADRFAWYGRQVAPGNYYGISEFRKLLALFAAYETDLKLYLDQQRIARGVVYAQQEESGANQRSVDVMIDWLAAFHRGEEPPLIAPIGITPKILSVVNPSVGHFREMLGYYDTAFREALMSSLGSLGINGEGARSLGESFRVVDAQRLKASLESFLRVLNGEASQYSTFMRLLTINAGYEPEYTPRIVCSGQIGVDMTQQRTDLVQLVNAKVLTRADIGQEGVAHLVSGLGFEVQEQEEATPTPEPLQVGSLIASMDILARLKPTDPAIAPISRVAAEILLVSAGISTVDAKRMVESMVGPEKPPASPGQAQVAAAEPVALTPLLQTRASRIPNVVATRMLDGLLRHEATPDVTISADLTERARKWVRGAIPSDEDVRAAMEWLTSQEGRQALASRAGEPEWLLAQVYGGRDGAMYWQREWTRRGLANAEVTA